MLSNKHSLQNFDNLCPYFQDIQVYRYYRDLINFRSKGDPSMMLKCINPNEAKYLDPAMGVHVKFRLAGVRNIFTSM